ncbi:hypothetical protein DVDV_0859 [Desulfovibrio sp. DV]|uniref:hypothetical protein n=1 Tax=Desulfovibrio sp. DV TaxID=1844708 RepID=UPI00094BB607|nr:hypothetical protein [Desulfovibrio sp. DV]OLN29862.1 hypothetical protein DVDV_0859 [Desulfovibrio sp. DV]
MCSSNARTLEDHLYRISSKIIFLKDYLQSTEALPGLVDVVEDLAAEAETAINLCEAMGEAAEAPQP